MTSLGRQFARIVDNGQDASLGFHFLQSTQDESAQAHVVFDATESAPGSRTQNLHAANELSAQAGRVIVAL